MYSSLFSFADGDICLLSSVDRTSKLCTRYQVHKNVLSRHSSVFKDMFDNAVDEDGAEVVLQDSASAVTSFLSHMYSKELGDDVIAGTTLTSLRVLGGPHGDMDYAVEALLVADKYDIHDLQSVLEAEIRSVTSLLSDRGCH